MNCEQIKEFLPEYWDGTLDQVPRAALDAHLGTCPGCRNEAKRLKTFWLSLGAIPEEQPDPAGRSRIEAILAEHRRQLRRNRWDDFFAAWWPQRPAAQAALAASCLLVGLLAGHAVTLDRERGGEVARLREEVTTTRQLVALSLMRQPLATDRLKGVDWTTQVARPEPQLVNALLETVNYDDTVDVRLAAVDALHRISRQSRIEPALLSALDRQDSPLVQIALMDALADHRTPAVREAIRRLENNPSVNPAVRSHAVTILEQMR
jgi:hypothetical protein